ncbi:MAG TPA: polyprenyl synthetase family protein [Actinomycetota bacterium]|nr:polyprenyl synthetase family protein [Actinomycetota bacterium]
MIPGLDALDERLEAEIRPRMDGVEDVLAKAVEADSDVLGTTAGYLLAAGGKRFRPMLVLLSGYFGDPTDPRLIPGAAAIELTHVATLYHDDVMDEAASRHGVPSVNTRWDNTIAILTGDFLFARSSELAADLGPDVCRLLAQTIAILCDGQIRDVASAGDVDKTEQDHLEVIKRKTGVLIASSCRMGGMLSDCAPEDLETLGAFAESLGLAFQLSDDIMDITSTQLELGKEPGTDIREGVYTIPVLHALTTGPDKDELRRILSAGPPDGELLDRALEIVRSSGSVDHARAGVSQEVTRAIELALRLPDGHAQHALVQLARFLAVRCGAEVEPQGDGKPLLGYGRAGEGAES